jgi:tetratricopeptide (TPR) repeat protein
MARPPIYLLAAAGFATAALAAAALLEFGSTSASAEVFVWIDEHGVTQITDDPSGVPAHARNAGQGFGDLWSSPVGDEPVSGSSLNASEARIQRLIRGAIDDLGRGETARASVALDAVLRESPGDPVAHWYLALLDRQRGRYESARVHLEAFLAAAGDDLESWRQSALRRLAALDDEVRLADPNGARATGPWQELSSAHFLVHYDPELEQASPNYAQTVLRYLEEARASVSTGLGAVPRESMGVVFYGKAAYLKAHRHRFSFQTVGFFDGKIHVVSAAHPAGKLRALLFHEYSHAVYREQTGGDRPYWLNEGLAEISERESLRRKGLTRSEQRVLRDAIDTGKWIPLRRLAPSFSDLDDEGARAAYLESAAAAQWIVERTDPAQRAKLLGVLGTGVDADQAFLAILGVDTDAVDGAIREAILSEFPSEAAINAPHREPAKLREATP